MPRQIEPILSNKDTIVPLEIDYAYGTKIPNSTNPPQPYEQITQNQHVLKDDKTTWETTIDTCIKSIVSIKGYRARGLDTELPGIFVATGFIVDAKMGIILSNRHVVSVSPTVAQAILWNNEEIDLVPIYRDPVHDFGFFKYDVSKIRYSEIPGIPLYPQGAKVGQEVKILGNDAGEKLSILSGTLARLDRETPNYGIGEYNDFNTFYYQAASGTSSGSSGSPVLDVYGRAIALNAGVAIASSAGYYLPLDRAQHVLGLIQSGMPVPRGTVQATFEFMPYEGLLQLGLSRQVERRLRTVRNSSLTTETNEGLLVVKSVLPGGPADGKLEPGDILLTCNNQLLSKLFIDLETILDNAVETKTPVYFMVLRAGEPKKVTIDVQSLHDITPSRYLEFGGGVLNDLSYQIARSYGLSLKEGGVYVGTSGFLLGNAGASRKSIIVAINNKQVKNIDDFVSAISDIGQGEWVPIRYYSLSRPMKTKIEALQSPLAKVNTYVDITGIWDYERLPTPLDNRLLKPVAANVSPNSSLLQEEEEEDPFKRLIYSIVSVECKTPFVIDGCRNGYAYGAGIIVSLDPPLVICDRDTVPIGIGVISITFQHSLTVPAELLFLHPFYNFAVLKFDPQAIIQAGIKIKTAVLDKRDFRLGDTVKYIGLTGGTKINTQTTTIASLVPIRTKETSPPRWRAMNVDIFKVADGSLSSLGGVFADDQGNVRAIWMNFSIDNEAKKLSSIVGGIPARLVLPVLDCIKAGKQPIVYGLDAEFWTLQLSNARLLGLKEEWIDKVTKEAKDKITQPSVVCVLGITDLSTPSGKALRSGDMILEMNNRVITTLSDLALFNDIDKLTMTILRDGKELTLDVSATKHDGKETTEVVGWQGMLVQEAHRAAKEQVQKCVPQGVYVSCCLYGSPAQASLEPGVWIHAINQTPVTSLKDFIAAVDSKQPTKPKSLFQYQELDSNEQDLILSPTDDTSQAPSEIDNDFQSDSHVQIKYTTIANVVHLTTLKLDKHYWPMWHLKREDSYHYGWKLKSFD
ncbi:hypothetical protein RMATCC62417_04986 [Rhizopus microsporus]|nr:hypothetical protein RMATCC62417_04986 [Rhizopus microsporus]